MKKLSILIGFGLYSTFVFSQNSDIQRKAEILNNLYIQISTNSKVDIGCYQEFFAEFPNDFDEFTKIYGYKDLDNGETKFGLLYEDSFKPIKIFYTSGQYILTEKFMDKLFSIGITYDGIWQVDGAAALKHYFNHFMESNFVEVLSYLESKDKNELEQFWVFNFDGPHPRENLAEMFRLTGFYKENPVPTIRKDYPIVFNSMVNALQKVNDDWH